MPTKLLIVAIAALVFCVVVFAAVRPGHLPAPGPAPREEWTGSVVVHKWEFKHPDRRTAQLFGPGRIAQEESHPYHVELRTFDGKIEKWFTTKEKYDRLAIGDRVTTGLDGIKKVGEP